MAKINSMNIQGIRGVRDILTLNLGKKSVLVYGSNGTGKSSLTDAFEWFFYDQIEHLSNEEIGRKKGKDALRNVFMADDEDSFIEIEFDDIKLNQKKSMDSSLKSFFSNNSDEFNDFITSAKSENLILRYRDLVNFIVASKTGKLTELQNIIGFSEVAKMRNLLKKIASGIARNNRSANYDNLKSIQQSKIFENLDQNAYTDQQLIDGAKELIKPLNLAIEINSLSDINTVLEKIQAHEDTALLDQIDFFTRIWESVSEVKGNIDNIHESYSDYYNSFRELQKDAEKVNKLQLLKLLKEGKSVLTNDVVKDDYCPLCQQEMSKIRLIQDLNVRIEDLEQLEDEKSKLDDLAKDLHELLRKNRSTLEALLKGKYFEKEENIEIKDKIEQIKKSLLTFDNELKKELIDKPEELNVIRINKKNIEKLIKESDDAAKTLRESKAANIKFQIYTKLSQTANAYSEYHRIDKEENILTKQRITFEALYSDFIKRQEDALNVFLTMFSKDINDYYSTMNPSENIDSIKLVPIKKQDELIGITIEYRFFDEIKTPPSAYLSESHINCLGLSFFLASVKAFNKQNEFFVLDDVISSFDRSHRYRFAHLLAEKFSDFQVLLFTHEKDFFELVSNEVRNKGWLINEFKWTKEEGTGIEKATASIKEKVIKKLVDKNTDGLGNDIRMYTENIMKRIAFELQAKVAYRNNDINEKRMAPELLDAVQSKISKASKTLKEAADIPKIKGMAMFIGNTTSHDNSFQESIEDLDSVWEDINKTIDRFYCSECNKFLSLKNYDNVEKNIRCRCGNLKYEWKK